MKVLVVGKIWPEPSSSAAGKRTSDLLESLSSANWEVHFACAAQKSEYSLDLQKTLSIPSHSIELNNSSFDSWVSELVPDIVIFDRYMTEEQFGWRIEKALPECLRVIDTSDLHCLREARHQEIKTGEPIDHYNPTALREIASILRSDLSLVISEFEHAFLLENFPIPQASITYWPFMLDSPVRSSNPFEARKDFAMIGSFLHEPNWDAVLHCSNAIWPLIRKQLPEAELHIYGSYPPAKASQLNAPQKGFLIKGRADNAIRTLSNYRVALAPLRFGAGLKGKLFDGFCSGTPTAASPIAVEGVSASLPWGSEVHSDPALFSRTAIELYSNQESWTHAQNCGYEIAEKRFSKLQWTDALPNILSEAQRNKAKNRKRNFIGKMLLHHAHRSTEYMSRWIEAKNRA